MSDSSEIDSAGRGKKALVTLALGRAGKAMLRMSAPGFAAYAKAHGYDYVELRQRRIRYRLQWRKGRVNLHLEKFQLGPLFERYERIVYMDADILLNPALCPDLCEIVPESHMGVVADPAGELMWKRDEEMAKMVARFGELPPSTKQAYFNAGVLVLSRKHRELFRFDPAKLIPGRWPEQTALNYYSAAKELPRMYMDKRANFLPGHDGWSVREERQQAWAVHYAGEGKAKKIMARDFEDVSI